LAPIFLQRKLVNNEAKSDVMSSIWRHCFSKLPERRLCDKK